MVKGPSVKGNPLPPLYGLLFLVISIFLCPPSDRQDKTYQGLCYTSSGAPAGMRNSSVGPPERIDLL